MNEWEAIARRIAELERRLREFRVPERPNRIGCRVIRTTAQTIPNDTWTALSFDTEIFDYGNCWTSANPTRLYAPEPGLYIVSGGWTMNGAGVANAGAGIAIRVSGSTLVVVSSLTMNGSFFPSLSCSTAVWLNAGDYIEILARQITGASQSTYPGSVNVNQHTCFAALARISS